MICGRRVCLIPTECKTVIGIHSPMISRTEYQICLQSTGEMIGEVYYITDNIQHTKAEIVIEIRPFYRGRGYGEDTLYHLLDKLLSHQSWESVTLFVSVLNPKARQLYEKLGFEVVRTIVQGGYDPQIDNLVDLLEMELHRTKWRQWRRGYQFKE